MCMFEYVKLKQFLLMKLFKRLSAILLFARFILEINIVLYSNCYMQRIANKFRQKFGLSSKIKII